MTQEFSALLKRYRPVNILKDEVKKRDYMFRNVKKDPKWKGGRYQIPVNTAPATSVKFGALTAADAIDKAKGTMAYETDYITVVQSLIFDQMDLAAGDNYEGSFIKVMMDTLAPAARFYKEVISHSMLLGSRIDSLTANGDAAGTGIANVNFPERFEIDQLCVLKDSDSQGAFYVIAVDLNANTVTFSDTRGGAASSIADYTTAKSAAIYYDGTINTSTGAAQNTMNSLRDALLSAANGGSANLHNVAKASYKQWQAHQEDLSGASAADLVEYLFKAWVKASRKGRGNPSEVLISFDNFQYIVNSLETNRRFSVSDLKAGYGFQSVRLMGPGGALKLTALREMDNDIAPIIDWSSFKLAGMRFFEPVKSPKNGDVVFEVRNTSGYQFIMDVMFYGNLIFHHPSYNGIGCGISI